MFPRQAGWRRRANPTPPSKEWLVCTIRKERKKGSDKPCSRGFPCGVSASPDLYGEGGTGYLFVLSCAWAAVSHWEGARPLTRPPSRPQGPSKLLETELHPPNFMS